MKIKQACKAILAVSIVIIYMLHAFCFYPVRFINKFFYKRISSLLASFYLKILLNVLGIHVVIKNDHLIPSHQAVLSISNHLGYVEIFSIASILPLSFITSFEMRERKGVGLLCDINGASYVERRREKRSSENRKEELNDIYQTLNQGVNIALYPEATSTNAEQVLPFKKPMFIPAFDLNIPVLASVVNVISINNEKFSIKNRDFVCWYGDFNLIEHIWRFLSIKEVTVEIEFLELIYPERFQELPALVKYSEDLIRQNFKHISK